jgi:AraC family transcriptional regulator
MAQRSSTAADYARRVLQAQQHLEAHLDDELRPAELARAACFSLHHFHRIFRAHLGETVMQHLRRLRLERAARALRAESETRILELALAAGYESHEAFTRAFVEHFGLTPSAFRETSGRLPRPPSDLTPRLAVEVRHVPARRVAFLRHRGSYLTTGATWARLLAWVKARGLAPELYGLCPDDPDVTAEPLLRFDACVAVAPDFEADDLVGVTTIAEGPFAVAVHRGPYERLAETYLDLIGRWFPASGLEPEPLDAVVEHYLDDPEVTPASELRTEVRVRVAGERPTSTSASS